jgi:alkaline phosphatase D
VLKKQLMGLAIAVGVSIGPMSAVDAAFLSHGPLVGGVDHQGAKIFVRTDVEAEAQIEYWAASGPCAAHQFTQRPSTKQSADFTLIFELTGLCSDTLYYYTVLVDRVSQFTETFPSFRTFPDPSSTATFGFAVLADLRGSKNSPAVSAPVYATVASEGPAFVMQIGDFDHRNPKGIAAARDMHKEVRSAATPSGLDFLTNIACCYPFFHVWDDHDYGRDNGDKTFTGKARAIQAFREYYPLPTLPNPTAGIWHSFRYAQVEFFMLDLRSQRDPSRDPDGVDHSMLDGDNILDGQKEWLKNGLLNSTATWKFIVSSVSFNRNSGKRSDSWMGYMTERMELVDFIRNNGITGVIVLSADLHSGGGIDSGANSDFPEVTVPHTNLDRAGLGPCAGVRCTVPFWSEGIISGADVDGGYAFVTVTTAPDQVKLQVKGVSGIVGIEYVVGAP